MQELEHYDIVIVGGGAAGCVLARRLAESGDRSVLLLEAGPDLRSATPPDFLAGWRLPTIPDWGFAAEPDATGLSAKLRRGRLLGGTSWLTRFAVRGAAADFDAWAAAGNEGWNFDSILPAFQRIETDGDFAGQPVHGERGPIAISRYLDLEPSEIHIAALDALSSAGFSSVDDLNAPAAIGVGRMPMSVRDGSRVTTVDAYLALDAPVPQATVAADSPVANVVIEGSRATGVRPVDGTRILADLVVLAAGTYGSPPILLRSGIGPASHLRSVGIDVRVDLSGVGANLADHPGVDLDSGWRGPGSDGPILHSLATFRSATASSPSQPDLMFWISDPDATDPGFYLDPVLLRPESRGTVRLRSADPTEPPRIELPGLREAVDVERLVEGYRRGLELAHRTELRRVCEANPPPDPVAAADWRRRVAEGAYSIPHVVGTCAMGPNPDAGAVVNAMGLVHGVERLAVVDASIIPEAPTGFPHLITIMIAEHLAPRLARLA